jgi:5-(carboxyamino)imidazole ribonucleotide mutase
MVVSGAVYCFLCGILRGLRPARPAIFRTIKPRNLRGLLFYDAPAGAPERRGATMSALVGVIMGSKSDWSTLSHTADMLEKLGIPYEEAEGRGIEVIIAGAGGAAHLPGMCAAKTHLPVLGVPVQSAMLSGVDSLLSIVQMPAGIPVATLAIGKAGAINAALLSASILGAKHPQFHAVLKTFRAEQTDSVLDNPDPRIA